MMNQPTSFAPMLYMNNVAEAVLFYQQVFGCKELRHWNNSDGGMHVAELELDGNIFHLHEESAPAKEFSPFSIGGTSVVIGLFTDDVDGIYEKAMAAGAVENSAPKDYEYGYRQAYIIDPFGHHWQIQRKI